MNSEEKRANLYAIIAIMFMLCSFYLVTFVHEMGHAVAYIFLGGQVTEFVVTPFEGGIINGTIAVDGPYNTGITHAIIMLSGGLAVALLFAFLGFFKRPFLIVVPLHIIDGFAEVFKMKSLHSDLIHLTALFIVIITNHILYIKLRRTQDDQM